MAKRRLWRDTAPVRGSALLLWMAWVSVLAWVALATQFDTWQWQRSVSNGLDQQRSEHAVRAGIAAARQDLECTGCRAEQGVPWSVTLSDAPNEHPTGALFEAQLASWTQARVDNPAIATGCWRGLCALGRPSSRSAAQWLMLASEPESWQTGSAVGDHGGEVDTTDLLLDSDHTRYWLEPWVQVDGAEPQHWLVRVTVVSKGWRNGTASAGQMVLRLQDQAPATVLAWRWLQP